MCHALARARPQRAFFVAEDCHPQTIAVVRTRAEAARHRGARRPTRRVRPRADVFGVLVQYPTTDGRVRDYAALARARARRGRAGRGRDRPARADAARAARRVRRRHRGRHPAQRFGVPLGYGGPHAAFFATRDEHKRADAGPPHRRLADARGQARATAWRCRRASSTSAARRRRATSAPRRCCSRSWPGMYAVYHGPDGPARDRAARARADARARARACAASGSTSGDDAVLRHAARATSPDAAPSGAARRRASARINLRAYADGSRRRRARRDRHRRRRRRRVLAAFAGRPARLRRRRARDRADAAFPAPLARTSAFLTHPVFNTHHSEHEMLRYMHAPRGARPLAHARR